ncbi:hypothetical protein V8E54_001071 [Elaphomyces granulatus]
MSSPDHEHHSTGCFDDLFAVFKKYSHPIILLEHCAFKWMGLGSIEHRPDVDFLVRDSQIDEIVKSVTQTGKYKLISERELGKDDEGLQVLHMRDDKHPQVLGMRRVLPVASAKEKPYHITFWSESSYHLSVDGEKIEVPNTVPLQEDLLVLIEDRFNMEQPLTVATMREAETGFLSHFLAQTPKDGTLPIYIPSISRMVEALIRQLLCWPHISLQSHHIFFLNSHPFAITANFIHIISPYSHLKFS